MNDALLMTEEIAGALAAGQPVVALESTAIVHGLPYPRNIETARALEADIRASSAIPALIAVLDRKIHIGLDDAAMERLACATGVWKVSRADLAAALAAGAIGATTVAATMIAADLAGIRVFATGGIGGVHRDASRSFDISADLGQLARSRVAVVAAGAKAILDLPLTLEYLETQGVPIIGLGVDRFPAFWYRDSGLAVTATAANADRAAAIVAAHWQLGLGGGLLIANPIPDAAALDKDEIEAAIIKALLAAEKAGIAGKKLTPFLLKSLEQQTGGRSVTANIALLRHNASQAAAIANSLAKRMAAL